MESEQKKITGKKNTAGKSRIEKWIEGEQVLAAPMVLTDRPSVFIMQQIFHKKYIPYHQKINVPDKL